MEEIKINKESAVLGIPEVENWPSGHFYSPIASLEEIERDKERIFADKTIHDFPNIDLRFEEQLKLLKKFNAYHDECPFPKENDTNKGRYYFENNLFGYSDVVVLYSMMRHYRPKRIIEAGSGFSSAAMLDINDMFFDNSIQLSFVEPYPERLYSLLSEKDKTTTSIYECRIQDVDKAIFLSLEANDILFIDSTHVVKVGSDVNYLVFDIFPLLKPGVIIQIHDIFFPFELLQSWALSGRNWSEPHLIRAFLEHNNAYSILFWNNFLEKFAREQYIGALPLAANGAGGGSLWLIKNTPTTKTGGFLRRFFR